MNSGEALGWVLTGLINDHVVIFSDYENPANDKVWFEPEICGPCGAFRDFFLTDRGRAVFDSYVCQVPKSGRGEDWRNEDGTVNWAVIEGQLSLPKKEM